MKSFIVFSFVLAVASATYPYYYTYPYAQHIPVIDHNGVPVDTPDVQAAKALHLAAHTAAKHGVHSAAVYSGLHHGLPTVDAHGHPFDTPEVQLAKAAHQIAYNEAAARNVHHGAIVPIDTPEVQLAKAAHFAAHAEASARNGHYRRRRGISYGYPYAQHIPVIGHNGVPIETPEVQAAKAQHLAAHAKAAATHALTPVVAYTGHVHGGYHPIHIPVIGHNGVPVETPEVQAEKAKHLAAHAEASARDAGAVGVVHGGHYFNPIVYGHGAPVDTPEVQAARAAHLAAHSAAYHNQHHYF